MFPIPFLLLILAIATGGAVVGVADGAAPGDPLYGIDRGVEELRLRMTRNPQNLLALQENLHDERLEEVQDLATRGEPEEIQQALENLEETLAAMTPTPDIVSPEPDDDPEEEDNENPGQYCRTVEDELAKKHPTGEKLALYYQVDYSEIMNWACDGFGFGGIKLAYEISSAMGVPVEEVFGLKSSGMGWGEIKDYYGYKEQKPEKEKPKDDEPGDKEDNEGAYCSGTASGQHPVGAKLAERYSTSYDEIMGWFCDGYGFGEIDLAYSISVFAKVGADEVFAMRAGGASWGAIMDAYGIGGKNGQPPGQLKDKNKDKDKGKDKGKPDKLPKAKPTKKPKPKK